MIKAETAHDNDSIFCHTTRKLSIDYIHRDIFVFDKRLKISTLAMGSHEIHVGKLILASMLKLIF
jgi:hypothetical protein